MTSHQNLQSKIFNLKSHRSLLAISGEDARNFLQGLITNDINKLSETCAVYALMLNPQGRFLYDLFLYENNGRIFLDCNTSKLEEIKKKLAMYKLRSKVLIEDLSDKMQVVAIPSFSAPKGNYIVFYKDPRNENLPIRALITPTDYKFLQNNGLFEGNIEEYELIRINLCIPSDADMEFDKAFPLEYEMDTHNAIDYKKGCYVGQEVTARTHYRGMLRKKPYIVAAKEDINLSTYKNLEITAGESKIGVLCSTSGNIGIALLRVEDLEKSEGNIEIHGVKLGVNFDK